MDEMNERCDARTMKRRPPSVLDELDGAKALGALLVGDLDGAVEALESVPTRYLLGLLLRLSMLSPTVSVRIGYHLARRHLSRPGQSDG